MQLNGLLECGRSLKVEGSFTGDLVSTGEIFVAPAGKIAGDLKGLKFLLVEGQVGVTVLCVPTLRLKVFISPHFFFAVCMHIRHDLAGGGKERVLFTLFLFFTFLFRRHGTG